MKMHMIKILLLGLLAMVVGIATAHAGTKHYYYTDAQGTVLAKTDAQGNIVATYDYAPYGAQVIGTPPSGPTGYTGHVNDAESGFVYMQARYYDPGMGRFLSVDPVGSSPGSLFGFGRYTYANNNPVANIDPDGRESACVDESNHCNGPSPNSAAAARVIGHVGLGALYSVANLWNRTFHHGSEGEQIIPKNSQEASGMAIGAAAMSIGSFVLTEGESAAGEPELMDPKSLVPTETPSGVKSQDLRET